MQNNIELSKCSRSTAEILRKKISKTNAAALAAERQRNGLNETIWRDNAVPAEML